MSILTRVSLGIPVRILHFTNTIEAFSWSCVSIREETMPLLLVQRSITASSKYKSSSGYVWARLLMTNDQWHSGSRRSISYSQLQVEKTHDSARLKSSPKKEDLTFGTTISDHMLMVEWGRANGWGSPTIKPLQNLSLSPAASSLHYGTEKKNKKQHGFYHTSVNASGSVKDLFCCSGRCSIIFLARFAFHFGFRCRILFGEKRGQIWKIVL